MITGNAQSTYISGSELKQYFGSATADESSFNAMGLKCHLPRGSFYAFPSIKSTGLSSKDFAVKLLEQEKVACVPGTAFGPTGEGFLRCCFATSLDQIQIATERIGRFVKKNSR